MSICRMHLGVNISNALQQLESVKAAVDQSDDPKLKVRCSTITFQLEIFLFMITVHSLCD